MPPSASRAIIVMTKTPEAGRTKTRLMPTFTGSQCARLHRAFLRDIASTLTQVDCDVFVALDAMDPQGTVLGLFGPQAKRLMQHGDGLGMRLFHALSEVLAYGYHRCLIIGGDSPELTVTDINHAFSSLETYDCVIKPTHDGGYSLIVLKEARFEPFSISEFSHDHVLIDTLAALTRGGMTTELLATGYDIDVPADVFHLVERLDAIDGCDDTSEGPTPCPETRKVATPMVRSLRMGCCA